MPVSKPFTFVCGQDDFLVGRLGQERFAALSAGAADEFAIEVISGFAGNVDEVGAAVNRFREAVQTIPMFGGRRIVHLKDVNFLRDSVTGRAEGTEALVEDLRAILEAVNPEETAVLITAAPVDRRRSFPKWCEAKADFVLVGGDAASGEEALAAVVLAEARAIGATFGPGAVELLLARVGANTRLLVEEVRKLSNYAGDAPIAEADVLELTPNVAQGDFFETTDAFFSGDLKWTLAALQRHFFAGGDSRPLIAALQGRNRLLIQVRALLDSGEIRSGPRGIEGLPVAAAAHREKFGEAADVKSPFNVFTQNAWYLGKLSGGRTPPPLRRLIDNQQEFVAAFEEVHRRDDQEEVLREMAVRCLTAGS